MAEVGVGVVLERVTGAGCRPAGEEEVVSPELGGAQELGEHCGAAGSRLHPDGGGGHMGMHAGEEAGRRARGGELGRARRGEQHMTKEHDDEVVSWHAVLAGGDDGAGRQQRTAMTYGMRLHAPWTTAHMGIHKLSPRFALLAVVLN